MARLKVSLLIIDPQVDFMDSPGSALPVPGANDDMRRVATMLARIGHKLDDVIVTLDSHRVIDIAHPGMWQDANGKSPAPYTGISHDDVVNGIWRPRNENVRLRQLDNQTLGKYMENYTYELKQKGQYSLLIWPEHCLIGTPGHAVQPELFAALRAWEFAEFGNVDYVAKGTNAFTEHYGGFAAEVPLASDPSTSLNTQLLQVLAESDIIAVAGEALSHCVLTTVNQIVDNIGDEHLNKFVILTDGSSPVPAIPNVVDFPAIAKAWLGDMQKKGLKLSTTVDFLA